MQSGQPDTSNGLDFVRERLALVGKTLFLMSFGFYLFLGAVTGRLATLAGFNGESICARARLSARFADPGPAT
jgi:hypothetical protein